jgi:glycosyltransferase involved in cell wall biosynthesis
MNILIVFNRVIPVINYGGVQRAAWWLGKELVRQGHSVTYLVAEGSFCEFAKIIIYNPNLPLNDQVPDYIDVVHLYQHPDGWLKKPYLFHMQSNTKEEKYDLNTVFVSRDHAERHHADCFVYNGIDPDDYGPPKFLNRRENFHFLAKASWKVKNVKGAIELAKRTNNKLDVIGGHRVNFKMGFRVTFDPRIRFHGMIGGKEKNDIIGKSKGMIFPVIWHEPFGIAIIESMYFGCPVFGTPYGSLPEIVDLNSGVLSNKKNELEYAINHSNDFNLKYIHERIMDSFSISIIAKEFLKLYEKVMNNEKLNKAHPYFDKASEKKYLEFS